MLYNLSWVYHYTFKALKLRPVLLYLLYIHTCIMYHSTIEVLYIYIYNIRMASIGKLDVEVEVKSDADKFWGIIKDSVTILPKACPNDYQSIEVLEGDGKSIGSVRLITYGEGNYIWFISCTYM